MLEEEARRVDLLNRLAEQVSADPHPPHPPPPASSHSHMSHIHHLTTPHHTSHLLCPVGPLLGRHSECLLQARPRDRQRGVAPLLQARRGEPRVPGAERVHGQEGVQGRALPPGAGVARGGGAPVCRGARHDEQPGPSCASSLVTGWLTV